MDTTQSELSPAVVVERKQYPADGFGPFHGDLLTPMEVVIFTCVGKVEHPKVSFLYRLEREFRAVEKTDETHWAHEAMCEIVRMSKRQGEPLRVSRRWLENDLLPLLNAYLPRFCSDSEAHRKDMMHVLMELPDLRAALALEYAARQASMPCEANHYACTVKFMLYRERNKRGTHRLRDIIDRGWEGSIFPRRDDVHIATRTLH